MTLGTYSHWIVHIVLRSCLAITVAACLTNRASAEIDCAAAEARPGTTPARIGLGETFQSNSIEANGTTLHYVRGGSGPVVILLHGFPQDWSEWRHVMPDLAKQFTVLALDLRGVGGSRPTQHGYSAANLAKDVRALVQQLELERPFIAGYDIEFLLTASHGSGPRR